MENGFGGRGRGGAALDGGDGSYLAFNDDRDGRRPCDELNSPAHQLIHDPRIPPAPGLAGSPPSIAA